MYKLEISYETADGMFRDIFLKDYKATCQMVREFLGRVDLKPYEQDDLEYYLELRKAMETVLCYYYAQSEAYNLIMQEKEKDSV